MVAPIVVVTDRLGPSAGRWGGGGACVANCRSESLPSKSLAAMAVSSNSVSGSGHLGHGELVLQPLPRHLERGGEVEDLLAVLDGDHPAGGETAAVPRPVHLEQHRDVHVAGADEIGVEGMADPVFHRLVGREQGLGDHVPAEEVVAVVLGADGRGTGSSRSAQGRGSRSGREDRASSDAEAFISLMRKDYIEPMPYHRHRPDHVPGGRSPDALGVSLIGTAWREQGLWALETVDIRVFSEDKRGFLDDTPYGRRRRDK